MTPGNRLRSPLDFKRIRATGDSVVTPELVLYYSPRTGDDRSRLGFVVSRRVGGAVVRNRVRRMLREVARSLLPRFTEAADVVVVAREPVRGLTMAQVRDVLEEGAARAGLIDRQQQKPPI